MSVQQVTSASFRDLVLESEIPVVVDFYADWCGPCHMVAPVITALAQRWDGRVRFLKLNVDESAEIA